MSFLKEPVESMTFSADSNNTYDSLLNRLKELNYDIRMHDKKRGEIIVNGVWKIFNMVLWHCWADKLLFEVKQIEANKTQVEIFGLPNLLKIKAKKTDKLINVNKLLTQLRELTIREE